MAWIGADQEVVPEGGKGGVRFRREPGLFKLAKKFGGGVIGEAQANRGKVLIEDGRAEKAGHLLLLDRTARDGQRVAAS